MTGHESSATSPNRQRPTLKQPSAFVPIVLSVTALSLVLAHAAIYGVTQEADEGTAAHVFQLLLVGQLPVVGYFAIRWLPLWPGRTLAILALQALAGLAAIAAVLILEAHAA